MMSGELDVVHDIGTGVCGHVLFHHLFGKSVDASGQVGESGCIHDRFHELVVRNGVMFTAFYF